MNYFTVLTIINPQSNQKIIQTLDLIFLLVGAGHYSLFM